MRDSRLIQIRGLAQDIQTICAELLEEQCSRDDPHDMLSIARARKFAAAAEQAANAAYTEPVCPTVSSLGSKCAHPEGHAGPHRATHGWEWTDEQDRNSAAAIAASMEGRRD